MGVQLNAVATVNLTLALGAVSTTVVVSEAPAVIDTTTDQNTFTAKGEDLPLNSSGFGVLNLSLLSAGVASAGGRPKAAQQKLHCRRDR